jgi:excisionase family DNA binding protein
MFETGAYIWVMEAIRDKSARTEMAHTPYAGRDEVLLLTYLQVAKRLNISRTTVYQLVAEGKLTPIHIGRSVRIATAEFDRFVADLRIG